MNEQDENMLNDIWSLYFHDPNDDKWTYDSYHRLKDISSVDDFWSIHNLLKPHIHAGMFFLMREYVFPCWDDTHNKDGGCLSIKVLKQDVPSYWEDLCIRSLGETLLKEAHIDSWSCINGISTSPKKHFCIIKIWLRDQSITDKSLLHICDKYHGDVLFRSNLESISCNNAMPVIDTKAAM